ncbi:MAG: class I SAM-dependent methyltransferase [Gammaproteobacteria bacterium]
MKQRSLWDGIAPDYYDELMHPTTAALRRASEHAMTAWFATSHIPYGIAVEVGAGRPIAPSVLTESYTLAVATDISLSMLSYAEPLSDSPRLVASACALPFATASVAVVIASLGAPYNEGAFWAEVGRVLVRGGIAAFTAPAFEWALRDRAISGCQHSSTSMATYLVDGQPQPLVSIVRSKDDQSDLIFGVGLDLRHSSTVADPATISGSSALVDLYIAVSQGH